ncbi:MAG TPA: choice-of-anchor D domain-containing protein, partial [Mycobacteriales bacterium]|nr:choice-of-anchor D domain-containing protein [Mycobacteriales bacterium]
PLTIYATGVRNAFDLVWHSNGQLYAPTNGSASGGNTPATPSPLPSSCSNRIDSGTNGAYTGPQVPGLTNIPDAQDNFLFRVVKNGYYGHPNPTRCEWVLNGGNPTSGADTAEVPQYPAGTQPDRNWRGAAYDFGLHYSPDGAVEYKGNAFGGLLNGLILVARYSAGDDIIALMPGGTSLNITGATTGISGFTGFTDPLDIAEDNSTGNLYVTELGAQQITLLTPATTSGGGHIAPSPTRLLFNGVQNAGATPAQNVTVTNTGSGTLTLSGVTLAGTDAGQFQITSKPTLPAAIAPGASVAIGVAFNPTSTGPKGATLQLQSDDGTTPTAQVTLRGLGTLGLGGANEPSLQWILDTYQYPVNVGDPDPTNSLLPPDPLLGDEVSMQRLQKAGAGPVTIEPLAVFGPQSSAGNVLSLGYYTGGDASTNQQLFTVPNASYQTVNVTATGNLSFDPGASTFGFSATWPALSHTTYSDDALNTWEPTVANRHKVRVYPFKDTTGTVVPNAFVVAMEDSASNYDYQDIAFIVRNVAAAGSGGGGGGAGKYNFQPATAPVPTGYNVDSGAAYSDTRGFGWITQSSVSSTTHTPLDLTPNTRDRNIETDQRLDTLIHMQYPRTGTTNVATPGAWEVAVPNGTYTVTVAVGDPLVGTDPENYTIHVEGVTAISNYVPSGVNGASTRHATATVTAPVSDGKLTIDAIGGTNTKLDYVDISSSTPDTTPPTVSVSLAGTQQSPGVYANRVTVTVNASDTGGSGLSSVSYSLNNGAFQPYSAPFDINTPGSYTIVARATDGAGNVTTTAPTSFSVVAAGSTARIAVQNMDGIPFDDRLVFSRIGSVTSPPANVVHDTAVLRVKNTGSDALHITGLPITGPWQ